MKTTDVDVLSIGKANDEAIVATQVVEERQCKEQRKEKEEPAMQLFLTTNESLLEAEEDEIQNM